MVKSKHNWELEHHANLFADDILVKKNVKINFSLQKQDVVLHCAIKYYMYNFWKKESAHLCSLGDRPDRQMSGGGAGSADSGGQQPRGTDPLP